MNTNGINQFQNDLKNFKFDMNNFKMKIVIIDSHYFHFEIVKFDFWCS